MRHATVRPGGRRRGCSPSQLGRSLLTVPTLSFPATAGAQDLVNVAAVLGFDAVMLYTCGWKALAYLLIGTVMGGGLHPMAGHLIAEHYMFAKVSPLRRTDRMPHIAAALISKEPH